MHHSILRLKLNLKECHLFIKFITNISHRVIYPSMHYVIYEYWTKEKHIHDHEFVILGHASTPSSIYIQIYILKHIRCPTNYIAAFLLTNVFG